MNFVGISFHQASSWSIFSVKKDAVAFVRGPTRLRNLINPTIVFNASGRVFRSSNVAHNSFERDWKRMFQQWTLWTSLWTLGGFMPWKLAFLAVRKRCWGQHSRRVLVAVDSQTRDVLRFYPEKERPRSTGVVMWSSSIHAVESFSSLTTWFKHTMSSSHFPCHAKLLLTLDSDFRSPMVWFSQSEDAHGSSMVFSSASLSQGTRGFRYWMPMRPGWPVVKLNWLKKNVFYKKHPKFSKVYADSQEAFELWFCPLFLHYSTRVYRSFVKKSVSPFNAARDVKNDHHFRGSTTNCPAFHRDTSWSRDSRPIFSEGGGGFSP